MNINRSWTRLCPTAGRQACSGRGCTHISINVELSILKTTHAYNATVDGSTQFRCYSAAVSRLHIIIPLILMIFLPPRGSSRWRYSLTAGNFRDQPCFEKGREVLVKPRLHLFAQQPQGGHHPLVRDQTTAVYLRQDAVDA